MGLGIKQEEKKGISIAEYVANLQTPKQVYSEIDSATDDYLDSTPQENIQHAEIEGNSEQIDVVETLGTGQLADVLVNIFNVSFNVFARTFSQGYVDTKFIEAQPDELDSIKKPLKLYLKTKNIEMSHATVLLMAVLVVYAPKTFMLINAKKQAIKEIKEHAADTNV